MKRFEALKKPLKQHKMNLQLFAEPKGGEGDAGNDPTPNDGADGGDGGDPPKTFTQKDIDEIVSKRLTREQAKWQKDFETKLETEKAEAEKLARMSADERVRAELEKEKAELKEDKAKHEKEKLTLEVRKQLSDEGLEQDFSTFLMGHDAESSLENIKTFKESFFKAVEAEVLKRLSGNGPGAGGGKPESTGIGARLAKARSESQKATKENPYF